MRVLFEEVVLHLPGMIDTDPVSELDLVERILKQLQLLPLAPRPRQLVLIKDAELHRSSLTCAASQLTPPLAVPASAASSSPGRAWAERSTLCLSPICRRPP